MVLLVLTVILVILLAVKESGRDAAPEPALQNNAVLSDESTVTDPPTDAETADSNDMDDASAEGRDDNDAGIAEEEIVQNIPGDIWKAAFDAYGKKGSCTDTIEEISPKLNEIAESDEELAADIRAMEELFSYWDRTNEQDYVNSDLKENLPDDDSLCIVILGYSLSPQGEVRDELKCRLDAGIEAAEKYPNAYILVTGGGTALLAPSVKEADKMAEYLIENGIDRSRIIVENNSLSTSENAVYSERLLRSDHPEINKLFIVTSDYHVPMACAIFEGWFIMKDSDLRVISNYACDPGNPVTFKIKDQVYWMEELLYFL